MTQLRHIVRQAVLEQNVAVSASTRLATRAKNSDSSIVLVHWSNQPLEVSEKCSNLALELFRELFEVMNSMCFGCRVGLLLVFCRRNVYGSKKNYQGIC